MSMFVWVALLVAASPERQLSARQSAATPTYTRDDPVSSSTEPNDGMNRLLKIIVLDHIPHDYVDDDQWGATARRFNGIRLRREGLRVETKRDWVDVNHGVWQKSSARLIDPEQHFEVSLTNVRAIDRSNTAFDISLSTPLALEGRQAHWVNGVQLYSLSIDAEAQVRLSLSCNVQIQIELNNSVPVLSVRPTVTAAQLHVDSFAVKRVSKLGGEFAQQVTRLVESPLNDRLAQQNRQLVEKLNREIEKHAGDFQIPLHALRFH
jgi:hypothetical protein